MPRTAADLAREQDNAKREAAGKAADASADSRINPGGLGELARAAAAKRAKTMPIAGKPTPRPTPTPRLKRGGTVRKSSRC